MPRKQRRRVRLSPARWKSEAASAGSVVRPRPPRSPKGFCSTGTCLLLPTLRIRGRSPTGTGLTSVARAKRRRQSFAFPACACGASLSPSGRKPAPHTPLPVDADLRPDEDQSEVHKHRRPSKPGQGRPGDLRNAPLPAWGTGINGLSCERAAQAWPDTGAVTSVGVQ